VASVVVFWNLPHAGEGHGELDLRDGGTVWRLVRLSMRHGDATHQDSHHMLTGKLLTSVHRSALLNYICYVNHTFRLVT